MAITSLLLAVIDANSQLLKPLREALGTVVSPIYYAAEAPYRISASLSTSMSSRESVLERNERLQRRVLELSAVAQQFEALREENIRLRDLLGSRARVDADVLVAELTGVLPSPTQLQVVLDKGTRDGVYVGQAVVDARGLFGQVVERSAYSSTVMLIADSAHAVPVQVNRNDVRSIAAGTGRLDRLELEHVPVTADIETGDLLVSSGLGGRFPRGYPVGEVISVEVNDTQPYAQVAARPLAELDRSRHVLLIFEHEPGSEVKADELAAADGGNDAASETARSEAARTAP